MTTKKTNWGKVWAAWLRHQEEVEGAKLIDFCREFSLNYNTCRIRFRQFRESPPASATIPLQDQPAADFAAVKARADNPDSLLFPGTLQRLIDCNFIAPEIGLILMQQAKTCQLMIDETERQRLALVALINNPPPPPEKSDDDDKERAPKAPSPEVQLYQLLLTATSKISALESSLFSTWQSLNNIMASNREHQRRMKEWEDKDKRTTIISNAMKLREKQGWSYTETIDHLFKQGVHDLPDFLMLMAKAESALDEQGDDINTEYHAVDDDELLRIRLEQEKQLQLERELLAEKDEIIRQESGGHASTGEAQQLHILPGMDEFTEEDSADHDDDDDEDFSCDVTNRTKGSGR